MGRVIASIMGGIFTNSSIEGGWTDGVGEGNDGIGSRFASIKMRVLITVGQ